MQCKTCGVRFAEAQREELRAHMDLHFKRNMRGKAAGVAPPSRRWLLPLDSWLTHSSAEIEAEAAKGTASAFDGVDAAPADAKDEDAPKAPPQARSAPHTTARAPRRLTTRASNAAACRPVPLPSRVRVPFPLPVCLLAGTARTVGCVACDVRALR